MSMHHFFTRYQELFGKDLSSYQEAILPQSIWITQLHAPSSHILSRLAKEGFVCTPLSHAPSGYRIDRMPHAIGATPLYLFGYYSVQEAASQFPAVVLSPQPGDYVVDMCAAPGMKTIQLASMMQDKGVLVACEKNAERLVALQNNLERCHISSCFVVHTDARSLRLSKKADKVLLDAPCSGNFLVDKTWLKKRKPDDFRKMAEQQKELLAAGIALLKSSGVLVYSTCSLEPEENEEVIDWALQTLPVSIEPLSASWGRKGLTTALGKNYHPDVSKAWRFLPPECQGFFVAKLRKQ